LKQQVSEMAGKGPYNHLFDLLHFIEELSLLLVPTAGVHNNDLKKLLPELVHSLKRRLHGIRLGVAIPRDTRNIEA